MDLIAQIQIRRGTTAEWTAAAPVVLAAGEPGLDTTLKRMKMGDGTTAWASLPWFGSSAYQQAVDGGYSDTEANFLDDLAAIEGLAAELAAI